MSAAELLSAPLQSRSRSLGQRAGEMRRPGWAWRALAQTGRLIKTLTPLDLAKPNDDDDDDDDGGGDERDGSIHWHDVSLSGTGLSARHKVCPVSCRPLGGEGMWERAMGRHV